MYLPESELYIEKIRKFWKLNFHEGVNGIPETDRDVAMAKIQSLCTIFSKPPNQENKLII